MAKEVDAHERRQMSDERQVTIYALCEPESNEIRYIGQSIDPDVRIRNHISTSFAGTTKRDNWIRSLLISGKFPVLQTLSVIDIAEADAAEVQAIKQAKKDGFKLVNGTESPNGGAMGKRPRPERTTITFGVARRTLEIIERLAPEYGGKDNLLMMLVDRHTR